MVVKAIFVIIIVTIKTAANRLGGALTILLEIILKD